VTGRPFSSFGVDWERFPEGNVRVAGVRTEPDVLRARIRRRVQERFDGLLEETRALLAAGHETFVRTGHLIGYAEAAAVLRGERSTEDAMAAIERRDRALARRQLAWFRRDPRVRWFEAGPEGALGQVEAIVRYLRNDPSALDTPARAGAEDRS
jgi:tRNA dimethylallyltransferase